MSHLDERTGYRIKVEGTVDASLIDWFGPIQITSAGGDGRITTIWALDLDQAALVGLIRHLHGLGIVLLSIERIILNASGGFS